MHYLIKHASLYWRANSAGYSSHLGEAGIYREDVAKGIQRNERQPLDIIIPLDINIKEDIEEELMRCQLMVSNLQGMLDLIEE